MGCWITGRLLCVPLPVPLDRDAAGYSLGRSRSSRISPTWSLFAWSLFALTCLAALVIGWFLHPPINGLLQQFFRVFNAVFDKLTAWYGTLVTGILKLSLIFIVLYVGLIGLTVRSFQVTPTGFIPSQDKGYLVVNVKLPDGASLQRTTEVTNQINRILLETEGLRTRSACPVSPS